MSPPTDNIPSPRKRADFPQVFRHERTLANRLRETSRYVGGRNACWCGSRTYARLALHRMEECLAYGSSAPGAYREGRLVCGQPLRIAEDDCQIHHRIWRSQGGSEMAENMELLHANCHRQIHVQEGPTEAAASCKRKGR